jgi:hypothetical protein
MVTIYQGYKEHTGERRISITKKFRTDALLKLNLVYRKMEMRER